ncbi:hypothetical protein Mgra_00009706 [Meloidogyne graminicola]|uniref:LIM zinc-binding domain-containing protein n=1 Tax=Meloidogyne graminicola TaxID=189291 RepID=A0A8S9Z746_9BILA|nr:hypothetical protein Mgra_00009706 [Meloidogyne graminicola]
MISENKLECKLEPEHLINKTQIAMAPTGPCASCHMPIVDQHFLFVDSHSWHLNCAHCAVCFRNLENFKEDGDVEEGYFNNKNICFAKDGFLFCRRDYLMKYGKKCQKCILPIERGDLVMKVPVNGADEILFHIQCFVCICCGRPLQPGEQYMIGPIDGGYDSLFCSEHFYLNPAILQQSKFPSEFNPLNCTTEQPNSSIENNLIYSRILPTSQENSKLNFNNEFILENDNNYDSNTKTFTSSVGSITPESCGGTLSEDLAFGTNLSENGDSLSSSNNSQKLKRLRTSFKHTQLRTMKAYFFINHNPDSKDLKVLSTKTGLTKRVLQAN